jgi:hypothetical protein
MRLSAVAGSIICCSLRDRAIFFRIFVSTPKPRLPYYPMEQQFCSVPFGCPERFNLPSQPRPAGDDRGANLDD